MVNGEKKYVIVFPLGMIIIIFSGNSNEQLKYILYILILYYSYKYIQFAKLIEKESEYKLISMNHRETKKKTQFKPLL